MSLEPLERFCVVYGKGLVTALLVCGILLYFWCDLHKQGCNFYTADVRIVVLRIVRTLCVSISQSLINYNDPITGSRLKERVPYTPN